MEGKAGFKRRAGFGKANVLASKRRVCVDNNIARDNPRVAAQPLPYCVAEAELRHVETLQAGMLPSNAEAKARTHAQILTNIFFVATAAIASASAIRVVATSTSEVPGQMLSPRKRMGVL